MSWLPGRRLDGAHGFDLRVVRAYARGTKRLGELPLSLRDFAGAVDRIRREHLVPLRRMHLDDLLLAMVASAGVGAALEAVVESAERAVLRKASRAGIAEADAEDVWQALVVRMLGGRRGSPLASYAGRASLPLFLGTVHLRAAFRRRDGRPPDPVAGDEPSALHKCMEREREEILGDVVRSALAELSPVERALLARHHDGGEPLTTVCVDLDLLPADAPHLRKFASRIYRRTIRTLRSRVLERARAEHGIEEARLAELVPRVETSEEPSERGSTP